ncbi:MAG: hypothetical protein AAF399_29440 [Bacteroidota bacterium]
MEKWFKDHIAITLIWVSFLLTRLVGVIVSLFSFSTFEDSQWIYFLAYGLLIPAMSAYIWATLWKVAKRHEPEVKVGLFFLLMLLQIGMLSFSYGLQTFFVEGLFAGLDIGYWLFLPANVVGTVAIIGIWASRLRFFGLKWGLVLFVLLQIMGGMAFQGLIRFVTVDSFWITSYSSLTTILGLVLAIIQTMILTRASRAVPGFPSPSDALIEEIGKEEL